MGTHGFNFGPGLGFRELPPNTTGFDASGSNEGLGQNYRNTSSPINLYLGHNTSNPNNRDTSYNNYTNLNGKDDRDTYNHINNNKESTLNSPSRDNSPNSNRLNYNSDSPDLSKQRQEINNSPGESPRSYSSQRNEENNLLGFHSPTNDSAGSRSPENLSAVSQHSNSVNTLNNNNNNNNTKYNEKLNAEMLDHKLQMSFLGSPLTALHSMTEMKGPNSPTAAQGTTANPHGIDTILSRPPPVTSAGLNALASGEF